MTRSRVLRRISDDRNGRCASRIAQKLSEQLEAFWCSLALGRRSDEISRYDAARYRARSLGFDYIENGQLLAFPVEKVLDRLEALIAKGLTGDAGARAALLGTEKRPSFHSSKLFVEYEALVGKS